MLKLNPKELLEVRKSYCDLPLTKIIINSWGEVSMCCHQLKQIGKLTEETDILSIWNNIWAKSIRTSVLDNKLHSICTSWNSCPFIVDEKYEQDVLCYKNFRYPTVLEICLPDTHCNIGGMTPTEDNPACIMCQRNFRKPSQPNLIDFICRKVKPIMPYIKHLSVLGIAEPFWKDALFDIYEKVEFHKYKSDCRFFTNTNVICLNEKTIRNFFNLTDISTISFSIDAASAEVFKSIRRLDLYDKVLENARNYLRIRNEFGGKDKHSVCIWNNINMMNVHEMVKMVEMAFELGVDYMIMLPTYDQAGIVDLGDLMLNETNLPVFKENSEKAMIRSKELGLNLKYIKRFDIIPPSIKSQQLIQLVL